MPEEPEHPSTRRALPDRPRVVGPDQVLAHLPVRAAVDALRQALRAGLDPARDRARTSVDVAHGTFLLMPSEFGEYAGLKTLALAPDNAARGLPSIQNSYQLHDAEPLTPLALIDGAALTAIRAPAVSMLGLDLLAAPDAADLIVFGTGVQALEHVRAVSSVRHVGRVGVVGRHREKTTALVQRLSRAGMNARRAGAEEVAGADMVLCCTGSPRPLFDGSLVRPGAVVVAMGSHTPQARETDDALAARAQVVVEDRATALMEAGDVVRALENGALAEESLTTLADLATGRAVADPSRPALVKTVGMGWQDLVVARALYENLPG